MASTASISISESESGSAVEGSSSTSGTSAAAPFVSIPSDITNVTVGTLANLAGLVPGDYDDQPESLRLRLVSIQLGLLQRAAQRIQFCLHHELAARHLPGLVANYRAVHDLISVPSILINAIAYTPYFARFCTTDAGRGLTVLQTRRITALSGAEANKLDHENVAEITQFYSTLLLLQGQEGIPPEDKRAVIIRLKRWRTMFKNFAITEQQIERCLGSLEGATGELRSMIQVAKVLLEAPLKRCASGETCERNVDDGKAPLLNCSRCKTAVYCGSAHQQAAWREHKPICYAPSF